MAQERSFPTRNNLPEKVRKASIKILNQALADLSDLRSQVKQAHWNLKGLQFISVHELLDTFAEALDGHTDTIAERATALGGYATGTVRMAAANSKLPEMDVEITSVTEYLSALADRYGVAANSIRKAIADTQDDDADTADIFTEVSRDLDKTLWFIEAHLTE